MIDPRSGGFFAISKNGAETTIYHDQHPVGRYEQRLEPEPQRVPRFLGPLNPALLTGPKLKIERAKRHIEELGSIATALAGRTAYELIHEVDPQTGENVFRMLVKEGIPIEVSAVVGDAIHNLRCALDYLVCDLARANGQAPHQNGGFPIEARAKRLKLGTTSKIKGVSPRAERLILRMKACERVNAPLFALNMLDVFDKHNAITAVAAATIQITAKVGLPDLFIGPEGTICIGGGVEPLMMDAGIPASFKTICPLEDNIEVHRSPPGFNEELRASIAIAFGKAEVIQIEGQPIIETLKQFTYLVERVIGMFERSCL